MNCPKCGLMNTGNLAVGLAMPQCMCQLQVTPPQLEQAEQLIKTYKAGYATGFMDASVKLNEQAEPVAWGVDWGKAGDIPCVSIIKHLPDGGIEVLAVEYGPLPRQSKQAEPVAWMYDQAKYMPNDLRGQQWHPVMSTSKPYMENGMVRNLIPLYTSPQPHQPCSTCEALARTVMMDQVGRGA